ncbi:MAG: glycosyltransferase family 2 protein, partial [Anaerolineae bacterium]|nr:glycosyltransferase family 2 protein [Anaerolineae bacterium]
VGGVSSAKRMLGKGDPAAGAGEGLYWRYESFLKACDSAVSSVMGAPGEIWAVRRAAYVAPEPDTLLDDFYSSMRMVFSGWRVVFEPQALACEAPSPSLGAEWQRRARNAAGGWQAFFKLWPAMRQGSALVAFQFLSHRILRWMVTPWLFPLALAANLALLSSAFYRATLWLQLGFYALAGLGWLFARMGKRQMRHVGWLLAPFYVCFLNAAALAGGWRFLWGRQPVVWRKVR